MGGARWRRWGRAWRWKQRSSFVWWPLAVHTSWMKWMVLLLFVAVFDLLLLLCQFCRRSANADPVSPACCARCAHQHLWQGGRDREHQPGQPLQKVGACISCMSCFHTMRICASRSCNLASIAPPDINPTMLGTMCRCQGTPLFADSNTLVRTALS